MKKTKFLEIIAETKSLFQGKINESDAFNDAGEPLMSHSQYRDYSEPAEEEYDDQPRRSKSWNNESPFKHFNEIDWTEVHEMLKDNTLQVDKHSLSDFVDENPEENPIIPHQDLEILRGGGLIYYDTTDSIPFFDVERSEIPSYEEFMASVNKIKDSIENGTYKDSMAPEPGDYDTEAPYMQGYEPLSEQEIKKIYNQFKGVIKENINEDGFFNNIKEVFYEFIETDKENPDTQDPDATIERGQNMKDLGQAVEDLGKKTKEIKDKAKTIPRIRTIEEYVEEEILPPILEIIKQSENPKATKKELLEMFNMGSKL